MNIAVFCGANTGRDPGILHAAQLNQGSPNEAVGYELNAIAAVSVDATSGTVSAGAQPPASALEARPG